MHVEAAVRIEVHRAALRRARQMDDRNRVAEGVLLRPAEAVAVRERLQRKREGAVGAHVHVEVPQVKGGAIAGTALEAAGTAVPSTTVEVPQVRGAILCVADAWLLSPSQEASVPVIPDMSAFAHVENRATVFCTTRHSQVAGASGDILK